MKNFKFLSLLLAVVGVVTFTSCKEEWTPGAPDANIGVYFPSTQGFVVSTEDTSVDIVISRVNSEEAAEVTVRAEDIDSSGLFTFPRSVSFAAGQTEANYTITFDGKALQLGKKYSIRVQIDQAEASNYAVSEAVFTIMIPEPWTSMGQGIYFDDFLCGLFEEADAFRGLGTYVEFEKSDVNENRIRVVNPFAPVTLGAMWGLVPNWMGFTAGDNTTYLEFDITDPTNVQLVGEEILNYDDAPASAAPIYIQVAAGETLYDLHLVVAKENPIVLEDGIIKFPTEGVELGAFYGGEYAGYFVLANATGFMQYYLPGTEFVNYDMTVSYDGMYVSANGTTAEAIFNFGLGSDVASYKFAFVSGNVTDDPSATIDAIVAGSEELTIFESDADTKRWQVELTRGVWTLVAVPYTAEGEARTQDALAYNFYFNGTGEMPEVAVDVELGVPSQLVAPERAEEVEAKSPACFNIGVKITANPEELAGIKYWYGNAASIEKAGITLDQLFDEYAGDASAWIKSFTDGSVVGSLNTIAGSTNTVYLRFYTIYGTTIDYISEEPYTLSPYDGDFYVGQYAFMDATTQSQMVFGVAPGTSYSKFFFTHPMLDGSMWYAEYDKEAATFTVSGVERGYEKSGNQYGSIYGAFNEELTMVYGYFSFASEESKGKDPLVFKVKDNMLVSLENVFQMIVFAYDAKTEQVGEAQGAYFNFTKTTQIAPYSAEPMAKALSASPRAKSASLTCGESTLLGAAAKVERVIKATPIEGYNFAPASVVLNR